MVCFELHYHNSSHIVIPSLYKFDSCLIVCLFSVCLSVTFFHLFIEWPNERESLRQKFLLYKFGRCLSSWLFVHLSITFFSNPPLSVQSEQNFPKQISICQVWSPELIYIICCHAEAHMPAQRIKMCMQL